MNAKRLLAQGLGVAAGLAPAGAALANGTQSGSWDHHGMMWGGGGIHWFLGPILMLLFLAVLIAAVVLLVRWLSGPGGGLSGGQQSSGSARQILEDRFARGEIDEEEFRRRKQALEE